MYISMIRLRVMDPHRNEVCPSAFIWIKKGGLWVPDHYFFPVSSLLSNPVFTSVFHGVTSSVGCKIERILRSNKFRKHCIKRGLTIPCTQKVLRVFNMLIWSFSLYIERI